MDRPAEILLVVPQGLLMVGFPGESEQDIENTTRFALEMDIDKTNFSIIHALARFGNIRRMFSRTGD